MKFILQKEEQNNIEQKLLIDVITSSSLGRILGVELYEYVSFNQLVTHISEYRDCIPVGNINFVKKWLELVHNKIMTPIEVPSCLRTGEFLKRQYRILEKGDLPKNGAWFIKDADTLKNGSFLGDAATWWKDYSYNYPKTTRFVISEQLMIFSEWRIYVIDGEIENVSNYDGDPTIFPQMNMIHKMVAIYNEQFDAPNSYTIDIMVTDKGTAIIGIHPFTSVGLYSTVWEANLMTAYKDGIDWYIKHGKHI